MYKIAIIYSVYPEIEEAANELISRKGYHVEIAIGVLDKAVELAKKYEADGFDLIISRGVTGRLIRSAVSIPVVLVEITNYDIIRTLYHARQYGKKIAFLHYAQSLNYHDLEFIREILGMSEDELQILSFSNDKDLKKQLELARKASVDVIVATGAYILDAVSRQGVKAMMIHSTQEAIYSAFGQAENILKNRYAGQELYGYFHSLVETSYAGHIFIDTEEKIKYISPVAGRMLKIAAPQWINKNINELYKSVPALHYLSAPNKSNHVSIGDIGLSVNKSVLTKGNEVIGFAIKIEYSTRPVTKEDHDNTNARNNGLVSRYNFCDIIGKSEGITKIISQAQSFARTDLTVLITGESGTGKEVIAGSIHNSGPRKKGPFVAVNCASLPESLLESELFGYEEGAFTGARRGGKAGLFETARGGTIFLDEISEVNLSAQAQLLRVLQEKAVRRIGGSKVIPVDVRIIAASNADLLQKIKEGKFREDLFYRLNVLNLRLPPLRERSEDIPLLIKHLLAKKLGSAPDIEIPEAFTKKLQAYRWPGNIRELENFIDKFVILYRDNQDFFPLLEELFFDFSHYDSIIVDANQMTLNIKIDSIKKMELEIIEKLYERYKGDKSSLARILGISRSSLWSKLKVLGKERG